MARPRKTEAQNILSPPQLQAIGLVAAQWSSLEIIVLYIISKAAKISFSKAVILSGSSNLSSWLEVLRKLIAADPELSWKETKIVKLSANIKKIQTNRNNIVHAYWQNQQMPAGLLMSLKSKQPAIAKGIGIPKRGLKTFIDVQKTAEEMRFIAHQIEEAEQEIFSWWMEQQPKGSLALLVQALRAPHNPQTMTAMHQTPPQSSLASLGKPLAQKKI